jgi:hypothetical protein
MCTWQELDCEQSVVIALADFLKFLGDQRVCANLTDEYLASG